MSSGAPQGIVGFSGLPQQYYRSGTYTAAHGESPGIATIATTPFAAPYKTFGDLYLMWGAKTIAVPRCRIGDMQVSIDDEGKEQWVFHVLDRRWEWAFGRLRGQYNRREGKDELRLSRKKNARELCAIALKAMGEQQYDVGQVPTDLYPFVDWDGTPAKLLSELAEQVGCRLVYNPLNDRVSIPRLGNGAPIMDGPVANQEFSFNPPEAPDAIVLVCGKTLRQLELELEWVAEETTGSYVDPDKVSYRPTGGWGAISDIVHFQDIDASTELGKRKRQLAATSVYRKYRIKTPFKIGTYEVKSLEEILPLLDHQVETRSIWAQGYQVKERLEAWVFGDFHTEDWSMLLEPKSIPSSKGVKARFTGHHSIDGEDGLVVFSEPMYRLADKSGADPQAATKDPLGLNIQPARLWLRVAVAVRHRDTWAWDRYRYTYRPQAKRRKGLELFVDREDITLEEWTEYTKISGGAKKDNKAELDKQAEHYLEQAARQFEVESPASRVFRGFVLQLLDGAIHQVTWNVAESGEASTVICRHRETPHVEVSYAERRLLERTKELLKQENAPGKRQRV